MREKISSFKRRNNRLFSICLAWRELEGTSIINEPLRLRTRFALQGGIYKSYKLPDILFIFSSTHAITFYLNYLSALRKECENKPLMFR